MAGLDHPDSFPGPVAAAADDSDADSVVEGVAHEAQEGKGEVIELHEEPESEAAPRRTAPEPGEPSKE